jgi:hypothetical protein
MPVAASSVVALLSFPSHDFFPYLAYCGASALALYIALRLVRNNYPPSPPRERWATRDALRAHQCETWPQPAPYVSAGAWWEVERRGAPRGRWPTESTLAARAGIPFWSPLPGLGKGLCTTTQLLTDKAVVNDLKADTYRQSASWRATLGPVYVVCWPQTSVGGLVR